jgi:hypothetical protein
MGSLTLALPLVRLIVHAGMPAVLSKHTALEKHLRDLTIQDLQEILRGHDDLTIGGNKDALVTRVLERESHILEKGISSHYTVDDLRCMLRGHCWTIGTGKKEDFIERFVTNLKAVVMSGPGPLDVSDPSPPIAPKAASTSKPNVTKGANAQHQVPKATQDTLHGHKIEVRSAYEGLSYFPRS